MTKRVLIKTNAPDKKKFNVVVTGKIEAVATVRPPAVYLNGKPGDVLESVITIMPSEKYKFSILDVNHRKGSGLDTTLVKPENATDPWKIMVKASLDKAGNVFDNLMIKTDSPHRPMIKIRVSALFRKQG